MTACHLESHHNKSKEDTAKVRYTSLWDLLAEAPIPELKTSKIDVSRDEPDTQEFVCSANDGDGHLFKRTGKFSEDGMVEKLQCIYCGRTKTD